MGKHKKVRRVSTKTKDSWELTGNRAGTIKVVDLETGEEGSARFIVDVDKDEYKIECRRCKKWGTYSLNSITDNQRTSGLCPNCYKKENQDNFYGFGKTLDGQWVQIGDSQNEESWFLSKSEINRIKKLKYPGIDLKLVKCPPNPFEKTEELLFVDNESDYGKAIQNRKIEDYVAKIKAFEKWKKTYPE